MAYTGVTLPLTGAGDATAAPAVDVVGGLAYQAMKLVDGLEGSTEPVRALSSAPGSAVRGLITRPIGSTVHTQAVVMSSQQTVTVGNPTTAVSVANPTTAVDVANVVGVIVGNPTTAVTVSNPTTAVDLTSNGSTRTVGTVNLTSSTGQKGSFALASGTTGIMGAMHVTSGTVLGPSTAAIGQITSGQQTIGTVDLSSVGSTREIGTVNQGNPAGSSTAAWWVRSVTTGSAGGGSTAVDLSSGGSTKVIGLVEGKPFSSDSMVRSTLNSSAEGQLFAANANRDYVMITNMSTVTNLFVGLTSAAVSTLGANAHFVIPPAQTFTLGGQLGNGPKYTGPIRCRINSTTIVGPVIGVEFST